MIAREGIPFILIGFLLTIIIIWAANRWNSLVLFTVSVVLGILTLLTVFFFRDPDRTTPTGSNLVMAPADGKIVTIEQLPQHPFVGDSAIMVSIFLSVFDVHVNRVPASGVVNYVNYHEGKFGVAFSRHASDENERSEIGMTTDSGRKLVFKQIAGLIARRIVCRLNEADTVEAGDRFGIIRFGSRADLILPADTELKVQLGDRVAGGSSVIARLGEGSGGGTE
jgi:phosphatidylserine decarboxylase